MNVCTSFFIHLGHSTALAVWVCRRCGLEAPPAFEPTELLGGQSRGITSEFRPKGRHDFPPKLHQQNTQGTQPTLPKPLPPHAYLIPLLLHHFSPLLEPSRPYHPYPTCRSLISSIAINTRITTVWVPSYTTPSLMSTQHS